MFHKFRGVMLQGSLKHFASPGSQIKSPKFEKNAEHHLNQTSNFKLGGSFNYFLIFNPNFGEGEPNLTSSIFFKWVEIPSNFLRFHIFIFQVVIFFFHGPEIPEIRSRESGMGFSYVFFRFFQADPSVATGSLVGMPRAPFGLKEKILARRNMTILP